MNSCGHSKRFQTIGGDTACETCVEIASGWESCKMPRCGVLAPPVTKGVRLCDNHLGQLREDECKNCAGRGEFECQEMDCHGEFCESGIAVCEDCGGDGLVLVPKLASAS